MADTTGEAEARRQGYAAGYEAGIASLRELERKARRAALEEAARVCEANAAQMRGRANYINDHHLPSDEAGWLVLKAEAVTVLAAAIRALAEQEPQG